MHLRALIFSFVGVALICSLYSVPGAHADVDTYDTPGSYSWVAPTGVTSVSVEAFGGGGGSGDATGIGEGTGGGGGGAYSIKTVTVTPGNTYTVYVGAGGTGGIIGGDGGDSYFDSVSVVLAKGGKGSGSDTVTGGAGGLASGGVGDTKYSGGSGGNGLYPNGGGGGSSAGTGSNGNNGANAGGSGGAGGVAPTGGAAGGVGGNDGIDGTSGSNYGGGAGGRGYTGINPGNGGGGKIVLTYAPDTTAPTITNVTSDKANGTYTVGEVIDIDVTFSEAVTSTGNVTVTLETGATDRTCTFTVTSSTTGTCNYTVQAGDTSLDLTTASISGTIDDAAGNDLTNFVPATTLAANKALVIDTTTVDVTAPSLSSLTTTTEDGTYGPGDEITIIATYNKNLSNDSIITVTLNNGVWVTLDRVTDNLLKGTYTVGESGDNESVDSLTIDSIYFELVHDESGNTQNNSNKPLHPNNLGDTSEIAIDTQAPKVLSFSPEDNATEVNSDSDLIVTFHEAVFVGTGDMVIRCADDDTIVVRIPVDSSQVSGNGTAIITINPLVDLDGNTKYCIQIPATAFHDDFGNFYKGIGSATGWNFEIEQSDSVAVVSEPETSFPIYRTAGGGAPILTTLNIPTANVTLPEVIPLPKSASVSPNDVVISSVSTSPQPLSLIVNSRAYTLSVAFITALVAASLAIASRTFTSGVFSQAPYRIWQGVLSFLGFNRKQHPWGRVIDAESGNPIPGASIQVFDYQAKQLKETLLSNERGLFSLLVPHGSYEFKVIKSGWVLTPSAPLLRLVAGEHVYDGSPVAVTETKVLPLVLAMRLTQEVPHVRNLHWRKVLQALDLFIVRLSWPLLVFGVVLNTFAIIVAPSRLNFFIEALYAVLVIWKILLHFLQKSALGYIRDADTDLPLDLAVVRIYNAENGRLVETRTTSHDGKFLLLPPLGVYTIMVVRAGYEPYRESHVVVSRRNESLALSFSLKKHSL